MTAWLHQFQQLDLPEGERLIWQSRPSAKGVALRVFHLRLVIAYFAALFVARIAIGVLGHQPWSEAVAAAAHVAVPLAVVVAILCGLALLYSRTTRYSVTNRRVLLQYGAVLPMTLNIPFRQIASAAVRKYSDGSGDLPLAVVGEQRLAFLLLWPHVRPWRLTRVEPMLRCVPDASDFAVLLAKTLEEAFPKAPDPVIAAMPTPQPVELPAAVAAAA